MRGYLGAATLWLVLNAHRLAPKVGKGEASRREGSGRSGCEGGNVFDSFAVILRREVKGNDDREAMRKEVQ